MGILTTLVSLALLGSLIASPIIILKGLNKHSLKFKFIVYLSIGILITSSITLTFAWWDDISNQVLLSHYGYDFNAMNDTERFEMVTLENMERVKSLEISTMGIGWPLKAFMACIFYSPYLLFVYLIFRMKERNIKVV